MARLRGALPQAAVRGDVATCRSHGGAGPLANGKNCRRHCGSPQTATGSLDSLAQPYHIRAQDAFRFMSRFFKSAAFPILIVIVLAFFASKLIQSSDSARPTEFGTFLQQIDDGAIQSATLSTKDNSVRVTLKGSGKKYEVGYTDAYGAILVNKLQAAQNQHLISTFDVKPARSSVILSLLTYVLPFLIFIGFWIFLMNQVQGGGSKVMSFGKSRAKRMSVDSPKITFRDVAGVDEAVEELHEIKEFLENPKKFQALGARIPKGVLLYGPPGTGKTLLARAVAGEAGASVFSISGSVFGEVFVGGGASRVRDLFEQAKTNSP